MAFTNPYLQRVYDDLAKRNPEQKEFLQAVEEVLESLEKFSNKSKTILHTVVSGILERTRLLWTFPSSQSHLTSKNYAKYF